MLEGISVLDLTQYFAGPSATRLLAELGADVIKVELAPGGDPSRILPVGRNGRSGYYVQQNRGKRAICVDFTMPESWALLADLAGKVDIVVENFGPGVLEKRGLDYATLCARYPRLVMASISAFGRTGPWSHKVGYDQVAQAVSGLMALTGEAEGCAAVRRHTRGRRLVRYPRLRRSGLGALPPRAHWARPARGHLDGRLAVLLARVRRSGSLADQRRVPTGALGRQLAGGARRRGCSSGPQGWIVVLVLDRQWPGFCEAIGRPELVTDPRYATGADRVARRAEVNALLEGWMAGFASDAAPSRSSTATGCRPHPCSSRKRPSTTSTTATAN